MTASRQDLTRCPRGASVVELAMIAPVLATLLIGMSDLSRGYSAKLQLEQAAQRTIELVAQAPMAPSTFVTTLKAEGAAAAAVPIGQVAVDFWLECNGVRNATYETTCTAGQVAARYVTVDITKTFAPMFNLHFAHANANGTFTLHGRAGVRVQ
jgi:Flp pilus assembly protein TadG